MASDETITKAVGVLRATWADRMTILLDGDKEARKYFMRMLMRYPDRVLIVAVERLIATRTTLYPNDNLLALIGEQAAQIDEGQNPDDAVRWILETINRHGHRWEGEYPTEEVREIIAYAGDWWNLCRMSADELHRRLREGTRALWEAKQKQRLEAMRNPALLQATETKLLTDG